MTIRDEPRFCTYCAAPLRPGAAFCAECGHPVPIQSERTDASARAGSTCRFCGATIQPEDHFCPVCGHTTPSLAGEMVPAPEPTEPSGGLVRRIVVVAIVVALLSGG